MDEGEAQSSVIFSEMEVAADLFKNYIITFDYTVESQQNRVMYIERKKLTPKILI